jgi:hypothetical protein
LRRAVSLMSVFILVISCFFVAPQLSPDAAAASISKFTGGATSVQMVFEGAGTNTTATLTLPRNATVLNASMDLTAAALTGSGSWLQTSGNDFSTGTHFNTTNNTENLTLELPKVVLNTQVTYNVGSDPVDVKIGDLDNDGKNDVAVSLIANPGAVKVLTQNAQGTLNAAVSYSTDYYSQGVAIGDLNADGRKDVAASNINFFYYYYDEFTYDEAYSYAKDTISVLLQNNGGTLNTGTNYGYGLINFSRYIAIGDINSDAKDELVAANMQNDTICVFVQDGSGGMTYSCDYIAGGAPFGIKIGDVDGDGKNDVVIANALDDTVGVFIQNAQKTLDTMVTYTSGAGIRDVAIGDFNNDGLNDVASSDMDGDQVSVYLQNNGGTLNARTSFNPGQGTAPFIIDAGDINSDGLCDIVTALNGANSAGTTIYALMQDATGQLSTSQTYTVGTGPAGIAVGDVNGDGRKDVVAVNGGSGNPAGTTISVLTQKDYYNGTFMSQAKDTPYNVISATAWWNATFRNQNIYVNLSNDGGTTWVKATSGTLLSFPTLGRSLMYRVDMDTGKVGITPALNDISISYNMKEYPSELAVNVGNAGTPDWSRPGELNVSTPQTIPDFSAKLMQAQAATTADIQGNVAVVIAVSSATGGVITLGNPIVVYDRPGGTPVLLSPASDSYVGTLMPTFTMSAYDVDGDSLMFTLETSRDNFATVTAYNGSVSQNGWSAASYLPGATASFTIPSADKLQEGLTYSWRARSFDGRLWSGPSQAKRFTIDTLAPTSSVQLLPVYTTTNEFSVNWSGQDSTPGSGLSPNATFDVQYRDGPSGYWTDWNMGVTTNTARFTGISGHTYYFKCRSRDKAGNLESWPDGDGDAKTLVDSTAPSGTVEDDGITTFDCKKLHAKFTFTDDETQIVKFEYSIGKSPGKADVSVAKETADTEVNLTLNLENGTTYYFNVKALNKAGLWCLPVTSDGIKVLTAGPAVSCDYRDGIQKETDINITLSSKDPNSFDVTEGELEYRRAAVKDGEPGDWSSWTDVGTGSALQSTRFTGEKGFAYQFRFRARNSQGTWSAWLEPKNVVKLNVQPVAAASGPSYAKTDKTVTFESEGSSDADGDQLTYQWNFGDGKSKSGASVTHSYANGGKYTVKLTVSDGLETAEKTLTIDVTRDSIGPLPPISPGGQGAAGGFWWWWILVIVLVVAIAGTVVAVRHRKKKKAAADPALAAAGTGLAAGSAATAPESGEAAGHVQPTEQPPAQAPMYQQSPETQPGIDAYTARVDIGAGASAAAMAATAVTLPPAPSMETERNEAVAALENAKAVTARARETGQDVSQADKLVLMASSFLQGDEFAKSVQYSKKATKISTELMARAPQPTAIPAGAMTGTIPKTRTETPADASPEVPTGTTATPDVTAGAPSDTQGQETRQEPPAGEIAAGGSEPIPEGPKCPGCGEPVEPEWSLCPGCGGPLREPESKEVPAPLLCPGCKQPTEENWMLCPNCNTKLREPEKKAAEKLCASCGKKMNENWKVCPFCDTAVK